jgi:hypothetical protein
VLGELAAAVASTYKYTEPVLEVTSTVPPEEVRVALELVVMSPEPRRTTLLVA